jgi:regulator of protease activity HflC (stomatin/prohibitin superfamily)
MFRHILVGDNELVFVIRKRRFAEILAPGEYFLFTLGRGIEFERHNKRTQILTSAWNDNLVRQHAELAARYFVIVETGTTQVALVYLDGRLVRVVPPSDRVIYFRGAIDVTFEIIDVRAEPEVPARLIPALARLGREACAVLTAIDEGKRGLVYLDGRLVRELGAGTYGFWSALSVPRIDVLEARRQTVEVPGQEILTRDKVTVRVNISAVYEIVNVVTARSAVRDVDQHLYRTLQIAVRQTLGKRTLEEVLAEKGDIDESVSAEVRREMELYGVRVIAMAIKDIILPGDIRDILNQVVTAEKQAQANLIRRREETAATRSLLNTAKLMEDNPILIRLKELEALEKIAGKVEKISVYSGLEGLLGRTIKLQ